MGDKNQKLSLVLFVLLAMTWGSSFILMKRGLVVFTPIQVGLIRIVFASAFTAIIGFKTFKYLRKKDIGPLFVVGWLGNGIPYILFPLAVSKVDSSLVGISNSLVPLFTLLVGLIWFKFKPTLFQIIGICIGFMGAFFLVKPSNGMSLSADSFYIFFSVFATICYAISINTIKSKLTHLNSLAITNLSLLTVGLPMLIILTLFTDFNQIVIHHKLAPQALGYIAFLGIVGSSFAVIAFNYLIKVSSTIFSSSVTYAVPIVAIMWGWYDGEIIGLRHFIGIGCILAGIYLVNRKSRRDAINRAS